MSTVSAYVSAQHFSQVLGFDIANTPPPPKSTYKKPRIRVNAETNQITRLERWWCDGTVVYTAQADHIEWNICQAPNAYFGYEDSILALGYAATPLQADQEARAHQEEIWDGKNYSDYAFFTSALGLNWAIAA